MPLDGIAESVIARGDVAHLELALWGGAATLLALAALRAVADANARFDVFVRELARFNRRYARLPDARPSDARLSDGRHSHHEPEEDP